MEKTYILIGEHFELPDPVTNNNNSDWSHNMDGGVSTYWFHSDHLGSSSYITDKKGNVSQHMEYLPFGETLVEEHLNSNNAPYKFNGKELDDETGNYYYGARYYDPKFSFWLSVDPLAEEYPDFSSYSYALNNPLRYTDPTGMYIVGTDGKPVTRDPNSKTGYSPNISKSALQLADAMNNTKQGKSDFNNMLNSTDQAYKLNINNKKKGAFGGIRYEKTDNGDPLNIITVYAGQIADAVNHVKQGGLLGPVEADPKDPEGGTSQVQADLMNEIAEQLSTFNAVLAIGAAVVSHEVGHVENGSQNSNKAADEILPEKKETEVLRQTVENIKE
jgi:RHS repeat-associated protein